LRPDFADMALFSLAVRRVRVAASVVEGTLVWDFVVGVFGDGAIYRVHRVMMGAERKKPMATCVPNKVCYIFIASHEPPVYPPILPRRLVIRPYLK